MTYVLFYIIVTKEIHSMFIKMHILCCFSLIKLRDGLILID